jgi:hypothetical protein
MLLAGAAKAGAVCETVLVVCCLLVKIYGERLMPPE